MVCSNCGNNNRTMSGWFSCDDCGGSWGCIEESECSLIRINNLKNICDVNKCKFYQLPDNSIWVLDFEEKKLIEISGGIFDGAFIQVKELPDFTEAKKDAFYQLENGEVYLLNPKKDGWIDLSCPSVDSKKTLIYTIKSIIFDSEDKKLKNSVQLQTQNLDKNLTYLYTDEIDGQIVIKTVKAVDDEISSFSFFSSVNINGLFPLGMGFFYEEKFPNYEELAKNNDFSFIEIFYVLTGDRIASKENFGVTKIGDGINIDAFGVISVPNSFKLASDVKAKFLDYVEK